MDLKQLKYFVTIAEERQITAAAKKLHMAQPPLSYQLNLLEQELGVTLVKRGPRNIELTEAGRLLHNRAEQILDMVASAKREVENYGEGMSGVLSLGTISSSEGIIPNERMLEFAKRYPNISFEVYESNTFTIIEMLEKGIIDLGIVRTPFQYNLLECRFAELEPMVAVMSEDYVCGDSKDTITLDELADKPLIVYRRFEELILEAFDEINATPYICCRTDNARTTLTWAKSNFGIGIIPKSAYMSSPAESLVVKEILHEKMQTRVAVVWLKDQYLSPLAELLVKLFEE